MIQSIPKGLNEVPLIFYESFLFQNVTLSKSNGLRMVFYVDSVYIAASILSAIHFFSNKSREFLCRFEQFFRERKESLLHRLAVDLSSPVF